MLNRPQAQVTFHNRVNRCKRARSLALTAACALALLTASRPARAAGVPVATPPTPQTFPATNVGSTATAISVTFNVTSAGTFTASTIPAAGINSADFAISNDGCSGTKSTGTCTVMVTFKPLAPGLRMGAVNLNYSGGTVATALIYGTGNGPLVSITPGAISTVAGNGTGSYLASQDTGTTAATAAEINGPQDVAVDGAGNLYIADRSNNRIRKVTAATGDISTVAGNGTAGYVASQDTGTTAATAAELNGPVAVAVDGAGNLYIADYSNNRIRKVTASTGDISTVAGNGTAGYVASQDTGTTAATAAEINLPQGVAVDGAGNLYIADTYNNRIRKVTASTGDISTVAGNGTAGYVASQDTGTTAATAAEIQYPEGVALDGAGNLYIADHSNNRIRKVTASTGDISTVAGNGTGGYVASQDTGTTAATAAEIYFPEGVAVDGAGNLYITDYSNNRIRKVTASTGDISTVAGNGTAGYVASQDTGTTAATAAEIQYPEGVALDGAGNLYIADTSNNRIRKVTAAAAPITFASEQVNTTTDAAQTVTLTNNGNQALAFTQPYTNNPSLTGPYSLSSGTGSCTAAADTSPYTLAVGATCTETISFAPVAVSATNSGTLTNTDNSNNPSVTTTTQTVAITGTSTGTTTTTSLSLSPNSNVSAGQTVTLTASIVSAAATGSVQFYDQGVAIGGANAVSSGVSTYQDMNITAGTHGFLGVFTGTGVYAQSSSTDVMLGVAPAAPAITAPTTGATVSPSTTISGTAAASSTVTIYDSGTSIGSTTATTGGTFVVSVSLAYGSHTLTAKAANSSGTSPASAAVTVNVVQAVGSTSPTLTATVTITGNSSQGAVSQIYVLTTGQPNLDFAYASGGTCTVGTTYNQGDTCTVNYTFTPKAPGQRLGAVQLVGAYGIIGTAFIANTGTGAAAVFPTPNTTPTAYPGSGFSAPYGVAVDAAGDIYVADLGNNLIAELKAVNGVVPPGTASTTLNSMLSRPTSVAVDGAGNVYVTAGATNLYEIGAVGGQVSSSSGVAQLATNYSFNEPGGVAVDGAGNVYVADSGNNAVVEFKAVNGNIPANPTATVLGSGFQYPISVAVDGSGNVYVADYYNYVVKEMIAVNGSIPASPTINTLPLGSNITQPYGVAVDAAGNVYVSDQNSGLLSEILAVNGTIPTTSPTILTLAQLGYPGQIAIDGAGNAYVGDPGNKNIAEITLATAPSLAFNAVIGGTSAQTVQLENAGNASLSVSALTLTGATFSSTNTTCSTSTALAASGTCNLVLNFNPTQVGTFTGTDKLTDNSLKATGGVTQSIALTGTATYSLVFTTPPPASLQTGQNAGTVVATLENGSGNAVSGLSQNIALVVTGPNSYSQTYNVTSTNGVSSFNLASPALTTTGAYTYTATSANSNTANASESVYPYQLAITSGPATPINAAGNAGTVQVTVENNDGSTATTQTPTVTLTVTGPNSYSQTYTATPSSGIASFNLSGVPLNTTGMYAYTATSPNLTSSPTSNETVYIGPIAQLVVTAANTPSPGFADSITVSAYDAGGNFISTNADQITVTSNPTTPTGVPISYMLYNGTKTTAVTFPTTGSYTLTATDNTTAGVTGTLTLTVQPVPTFTVTVNSDPATGTAANCTNQAASGATQDGSCSLRDAFAAVNALNYTGTANVAPVINFGSGISSIKINASAIVPTANFNLTGPGAAQLTIQANGTGYNFIKNSATQSIAMTMSGLTINGFSFTSAGAWSVNALNHSTTFTNLTFTGNSSTATNAGGGAAADQGGTFTMSGSTFLGNSAAGTATYPGGALLLNDSSATITTSNFGSQASPNTATYGGAVSNASNGGVTITNSTFAYNNATSGGAIYAIGPLTLTNDVFLSNSATSTTGGSGGAIYSTSTLTASTSTFNNNTAKGTLGGAIYVTGTMNITGSSFSANAVNGSASIAYGGAIYSTSTASNSITNSNFIGNSAVTTGSSSTAYGGALYMSKALITNVLFSGNYLSSATTANGGAIYLTGASTTFTGVTFVGNSTKSPTVSPGAGTQDGGAIAQTTIGVVINLYNTTITGNSAKVGGGIYKSSGGSNIYNTVISGNTVVSGGTYPDAFTSSSGNSNSYYNSASANPCSGTTTCTPLLSALGSYGGGTVGAPGYTTPVQVMIPLPGSPLLGGNPSSSNLNTASNDARGNGYPRSTMYNSSTHSDIGAAEANYTLAFLQQPTNSFANSNLTPAPTVQVYESTVAFNATPFAGAGSLTLSAATGTPSTLSGTLANSGLDTLTVSFPSNQTADTLTASITNGGTTVASVTSSPFNIVTGYIWLVDNTGALNKVTESGTASGSANATSGSASLGGIAFDSAGNNWSVTSADNALAFTNYANTTSTAYTGGGISTPVSLAVDGAGTIWIANQGNNSISAFSNTGTAITPSTGYNGAAQVSGGTTADFATPSALVLDNAGGVWVTNKTTNSVTHVFGAATPVTTPLSQAVTTSSLGTRP